VKLPDGRTFTPELYRQIRQEESEKLDGAAQGGRLRDAAEILDSLVLARDFIPFLTLAAYERLD
jgi:malate synthase